MLFLVSPCLKLYSYFQCHLHFQIHPPTTASVRTSPPPHVPAKPMAARYTTNETQVTGLRQWRLAGYLYRKVFIWRAVTPARLSGLPITLAAVVLTSLNKTQLRREPSDSSCVLLLCCWKTFLHPLRSNHKKIPPPASVDTSTDLVGDLVSTIATALLPVFKSSGFVKTEKNAIVLDVDHFALAARLTDPYLIQKLRILVRETRW